MMIRPVGDVGLLVEPDDPAVLLALAAALRERPEVIEVVPAARTLLVRTARLEALAAALPDLVAVTAPRPPADTPAVTLDVVYDGPDLAPAADAAGLDIPELVGRHAGGRYVVAFCGFAPGFAYLTGLDPRLHLPRRPEPRTRVPAGAVAIAGEFTGVYPRPSPGGWLLLGHTAAPLWQLERTPPALLTPGTRVTFRDATQPARP